jgi:hypothetical protein
MTDADTEGHYSAKQLHFAALHYHEMESRKQDVAREYALLGDGELCLCGTMGAVGGLAGGGALGPHDGIQVSTLQLDLQRAYAALPMRWRGRTVVYLMLHETHAMEIRHPAGEACRDPDHRRTHTEDQILQMMATPEFEARHRRRIALESFMQPVREQDSLPERSSPWAWMASWLHPVCRCGERERAA